MDRTTEIAAATFLAPAVVDGRECVCKRLEKSTLEYDFLGSPVNRVFNYVGPSLDGFGRGRESNQRPRVIQSTSNPQSGNRTNRWGQWPQQESNLLGFTPMNDAKPLEPDLNGFTANITATGNVKT